MVSFESLKLWQQNCKRKIFWKNTVLPGNVTNVKTLILSQNVGLLLALLLFNPELLCVNCEIKKFCKLSRLVTSLLR